MLTHLLEVTPESLVGKVLALKTDGFRFVTMTCTDLGPSFDLLYHFDKNYELHNLRLPLPKGTPVLSISNIYFAAAIVENEIKDLFGISFEGLAIDYSGHLLLQEDAPETPQAKAMSTTQQDPQ